MRHSLLLFLLPLILLSCHKEKSTETFHFGTEPYDSTALHLALMPNRDCLPIYYAKRTGLFDSVGVKVQIASCRSQLDCDTTLLGRSADGGWADSERKIHYGRRADGWQAMWQSTDRWVLFACGSLRIREVKALAGRTVAYARHTAESAWLDQLVKQNKLNNEDIYRPQIHDLRLRAQMLTGDQVDAAILSWPYTSLASSEGNRPIATQSDKAVNGMFVMKQDRMKNKNTQAKWQLFEKARKMALDSLHVLGPSATSLILQKDYGLPQSVADTVRFSANNKSSK